MTTSRSLRRLSAVCLAGAAVAAGAPGGAAPDDAAAFHVYGCKTPAGAPAPTSGWTSSTNLPSSYGGANNDCATGGALGVSLDGAVTRGAGEQAMWSFTAPDALRVTGATLWRTGTVSGGGAGTTGLIVFSSPRPLYDAADVVDQCAFYTGCTGIGDHTAARDDANRSVLGPQFIADRAQISVGASCSGQAGGTCDKVAGTLAQAQINASDITLDDPSPPAVGDHTATPLTGTIKDPITATVTASDSGSGLYALGLDVDGKAAGSARFPADQRCTPTDAGDGTRGYLYVDPCPATGTASLRVDPRTIPSGHHRLGIWVEDGSGNRTDVAVGEADVRGGTVGPGDALELRGAPNGSVETDDAKLTAGFVRSVSKRCRRASYRRAHAAACATRSSSVLRDFSRTGRDSVSGRLTTKDGRPIAGARISLVRTPGKGGGAAGEVAAVTTTRTGRFAVRVDRVVSGALRVGWGARVMDTRPAAKVGLRQRIRARSSLRLAPSSVVRRGGRLRFSGALLGPSGLKTGVPVVVQANPGRGGWRAVTTVRARKDGTWAATYRVPRQLRGVYRFRVLVKPTPFYPYSSGTSRSRPLRVR